MKRKNNNTSKHLKFNGEDAAKIYDIVYNKQKQEPIIRNVRINLDVIYDTLKKVSKQRQQYNYLDNVDVKITLGGKEYLLENTEYEIDNEYGTMSFKLNCKDPEHNPLDKILREYY